MDSKMILKQIIQPCQKHFTAIIFAAPGGKNIYCSHPNHPVDRKNEYSSILEAVFVWNRQNSRDLHPRKNTFKLKRLEISAKISPLMLEYLEKAVKEFSIEEAPTGISIACVLTRKNFLSKGVTSGKNHNAPIPVGKVQQNSVDRRSAGKRGR